MMAPRAKDTVAFACAAAVLSAALAVWSRAPSMAQDKPGSDPIAYFEKISSTDTTPYHARQLVVYMDHPQSAALLDIQSTPTATFVRADAGNDIVRLWRKPGSGVVTSAQDAVTDDGLEPAAVRASDIVAKYTVAAGPHQKILGVDVVPLTLVRRSDELTVERLWVNPPSGVVYRRELFARTGRLEAMSTIIDMKWGEASTTERYEPGTVPSSRVRTVAAGGAPAHLPYGYTFTHAYGVAFHGHDTTQWVYSDGLHALSVFAMRGGLRTPSGFVSSRIGNATVYAGPGPGTWAWEGGGRAWVVVAEEPDLEPSLLLSEFPHGTPSVWSRMGSLWSKGAGWISRVL